MNDDKTIPAPWRFLWRILVGVGTIVTVATTVLSLSEVPEWLERWKTIFDTASRMDYVTRERIHLVLIVVLGVALNVAIWWPYLRRVWSTTNPPQAPPADDVPIESERVAKVRSTLERLLVAIPSPFPGGAGSTIEAFAAMLGNTDWRVEARQTIRGCLGESAASRFDECLTESHPEVAARSLIRGYLARLSERMLDAPEDEPVVGLPLVEKGRRREYWRTRIDQLIADAPATAHRDRAVKWRESVVEALQNLLATPGPEVARFNELTEGLNVDADVRGRLASGVRFLHDLRDTMPQHKLR